MGVYKTAILNGKNRHLNEKKYGGLYITPKATPGMLHLYTTLDWAHKLLI